MQERKAAKFYLFFCFIHPVLLVLGLAVLAALSNCRGVIVAQVVKVRLIAAVAGFDSKRTGFLLHKTFSLLSTVLL